MGVLDDLEKLWSLGAGFAKDATTGQAFDPAKARAEPRPNPYVEREDVVDAEYTERVKSTLPYLAFKCPCGMDYHTEPICSGRRYREACADILHHMETCSAFKEAKP